MLLIVVQTNKISRLSQFIHILLPDFLLEADDSLAIIRTLHQLHVLSSYECALPPGDSHSAIVKLAVVEVDDDLLLGGVDHAVEALVAEVDVELVTAREDYLGVYDVKDVLAVLGGGGVIAALDLAEADVLPVALLAGTQLAVPAGDGEPGVLDDHLVDVLVVEVEHLTVVEVQHVDTGADRQRVAAIGAEDGVDKGHFPVFLAVSDHPAQGINLGLLLYDEVDDGGLVDLLQCILYNLEGRWEIKDLDGLTVYIISKAEVMIIGFFAPLSHLGALLRWLADEGEEIAWLDPPYIVLDEGLRLLHVGSQQDEKVPEILALALQVAQVPVQDHALVLLEIHAHYLPFHRLLLYRIDCNQPQKRANLTHPPFAHFLQQNSSQEPAID